MKTEMRTRQKPEHYNVYIADDGTEFSSRHECESYEYKLACGKREILSHTVETIEEEPATIYLINNKDDFDWLKKVEWAHCNVTGDFTLPGWYIAEFHNGGDWHDWYTVQYVEDYINYYQKILNEMKNYLV